MTTESSAEHAAATAAPPSLHDCLSLGDVEEGLSLDGELEEQRHRLPILLRLLNASRPHASIPTFAGWNDHHQPPPQEPNNDDNPELSSPTNLTDSTTADALVDHVVSKLEDMAATHAGAEAMDVGTLSIVPSVTRKLSRVPPLRRKQVVRKDGKHDVTTLWDTQELAQFHSMSSTDQQNQQQFHHHNNPLKRQSSELVLGSSDAHHPHNQLSDDDEDDPFDDHDNIDYPMDIDEVDDRMDEGKPQPKSQKRKSNNRRRSSMRDSVERKKLHFEDSPEAMVTSTMSELVTLVLQSLQPEERSSGSGGNGEEDDEEDDAVRGGGIGAATTSTSSRLLHDLVLSSQSSDGGSAMASIMHHAPVLRHQHVADALCRTGVARVATLVARLAANCPIAVPCLLRGCMDANPAQPSVAKAAVLALARLSPRESSRVFMTLQQTNIMWEVQLELGLMLPSMSVMVANLLIHHLSSSSSSCYTQRNISQDDALEKSTDADNDMLTDFSEKNAPVNNHNPKNSSSAASNLARTDNLTQILLANPKLQQRTLQFLYQQLSTATKTTNVLCWGQVCLYLCAYSWFQFCMAATTFASTQPTASSDSSSLGSSFVNLVEMLQHLLKTARETSTGDSGRSYRLVVGATIITLGRYLTSSEYPSAEDSDAAKRILRDLFMIMPEPSSPCRRACEVFLARIAWLIKSCLVKELCDLIIVDTLASCSGSDYAPSPCSKMTEGLLSIYDLAIKDMNEHLETACRRGISTENLRVDLAALSLFLQTGSQPSSHGFVTQATKDFLQSLLQTPDQCQLLIQKAGIGDVVFEGAACLTKSGVLAVPLVLPVQIEWLGGHVDLGKLVARPASLGPVECQFLLQLVYCFAILELNPSSPFAFDPRTLPLKEVLYFCDNLSDVTVVTACLSDRLKEQICKRAPEIGARLDRWNVPSHRQGQEQWKPANRQALLRKLSTSIRACCSSENTLDQDGIQAEHLFQLTERHFADAELHETVVCSLLAVPNTPLPRMTYGQLCRDPLVMLKLPLSAWKCAGLKRIVLVTLSNMLEANTELTKETCKTNEVALEMLAARNAVLARSLLSTLSCAMSKDKNSNSYAPFCVIFTSFLRRLIAETSGLVSMLVKENIPDQVQDWLIEFVPESLADWQSLAALLSDRCSLTASERLLAADSVLRIAIAHGHACEEEAQSLAFAALTLLVSSFFLVVGPVGVPVNALLGDDNSLDVMQASRKATLRMLRSLPHVRGRQRTLLRDECGMALQKLAGLCKGDSIVGGFFPGGATGGRKAIVKEVYDAVTKAANAMGSNVPI